MTDYLGDMITRIKNAQKIKLQEVEMSPFSSKNELKILKILYREGYFRGYSQYYNIKKKRNIIKLLLKYNVRGESVVRNISRISTPGRRIYVSIETLWQTPSTRGIYILSTPKGFLTDIEARRLNVGGELLFNIW